MSRGPDWTYHYDRGALPRSQRGAARFTIYPGTVPSILLREPARAPFPNRIPGGATMQIHLSVTVSADAVWNTDPYGYAPGANARPYATPLIWRTEERSGELSSGNFARWYAGGHRIPLDETATHVVSVPVSPSAWWSVLGKPGTRNGPTTDRWRECWLGESHLGLGFGGFFYSKGVTVTQGSVSVAVYSVAV
jgi:hypothetical protein